jgi:hypothetical protein
LDEASALMLIGEMQGQRVDAFTAERGAHYFCPNCQAELILKKGRKVVHHFAHKPPTDCSWAAGETKSHMQAKMLLAAEYRSRGARAEPEVLLKGLDGDRRADVMIWSPSGKPIAIEFQHTNISVFEIERRAYSYAGMGVPQLWIPFLPTSVWKDGTPRSGGWFVEKYNARPFEKWVHGFNGKGGMWMYDPRESKFWRGTLSSHQVYVDSKSWYNSDGDENHSGGYWKYSKRFRELRLDGPYALPELAIATKARREHKVAEYDWPASQLAYFTTRKA